MNGFDHGFNARIGIVFIVDDKQLARSGYVIEGHHA
jgi:hypothetical protein